MYEVNNERRKVMLLNKVVKNLIMQRREANKSAYFTEAIAKMHLAITRVEQNKQVHLLRTDYLE